MTRSDCIVCSVNEAVLGSAVESGKCSAAVEGVDVDESDPCKLK